jgi:hypothetical protein
MVFAGAIGNDRIVLHDTQTIPAAEVFAMVVRDVAVFIVLVVIAGAE